jgi:hypothetical protein
VLLNKVRPRGPWGDKLAQGTKTIPYF